MRFINDIFAQDDLAFARDCKVTFHKSGGPGGQKRNKASTAVRIVHVPTGIEAHSNDFRTQAENRLRALHRLRFRLAAELRTAVVVRGYEPPGWMAPYKGNGAVHVNVKNPDYARVAAHLLDVLAALDGKVSPAAALVGVSAASFLKLLRQEPTIWDATCRLRKTVGKVPNLFPE